VPCNRQEGIPTLQRIVRPQRLPTIQLHVHRVGMHLWVVLGHAAFGRHPSPLGVPREFSTLYDLSGHLWGCRNPPGQRLKLEGLKMEGTSVLTGPYYYLGPTPVRSESLPTNGRVPHMMCGGNSGKVATPHSYRHDVLTFSL
jgi:hypothetical protein